MVPLIEIERGTVVADRYVVSRVLRPWLSDHPDVGVVLLAIDAILDTPVIVYAAAKDHAGDLLDVGRRSALLTDPRIPTIQNVGSTEDLDFVVCSRTGTSALTEILRSGPLDPEAARAFVGELATALAHAARRGLHHLCLGPESVGVSADGDVVVHGIGIDAAVAAEPYGLQLEQLTSKDADREDALAVMDILYAALTAHWPGESSRAGLDLAPRKNNRFVAAATITPGIPRDLEEFVSGVVAGTEPGPRSATEIIRYLGQWDTGALRGLLRTPPPTNEDLFAAESGADGTEAAAPTDSVAPTGNVIRSVRPSTAAPADTPAADRASADQLQRALRRIGITRPGMHGPAAGRLDEAPGRFDDLMAMRKASAFPLDASAIEAVDTEWQPEDTIAQYAGYAAVEHDENLTGPILDRDALDSEGDSGQFDEGTGAPVDSASLDTAAFDVIPDPEADPDADDHGTTAAGASATTEGAQRRAAFPDASEDADGGWFLGGMFTTYEEQVAAQRAEFERERELQRRAAARAAAAAGLAAPTTEPPAGNATPDAESGSERPLVRPQSSAAAAARGTAATATLLATPAGASAGESGFTGEPEDPAPRDEDRRRRRGLVLLLALALVLVLVIGGIVWGMNRDPEPEPQAEPTPTAEAPAPEPGPTEPVAEPTVAPVIVSAQDLDPEGDDEENPDDVENVLPGVKGAWQTDRYNSEAFGNLKEGLGVALELEEESTVSRVDLVSGTPGGAIEIRVGDSDDPDAANIVAEGELPDDTGSIELAEPATGSYVFVWITELPEEGDGFRARISEVALA